MEDSTPREKVLKKVRKALIQRSRETYTNVDLDTNVYVVSEESPEIEFAQNFSESGGKFIFCLDEAELLENLSFLFNENGWKNVYASGEELSVLLSKAKIPFTADAEQLKTADVSITHCESLVSRTGSVLISSYQGRRSAFAAPVHIVIGYTSQLVPDVKEALAELKKRYEPGFPSSISFITGPSRTADIEKTLVMGAHGPLDLYVFLLDDTGIE